MLAAQKRAVRVPDRPEFIRLPPRGRKGERQPHCPYTGLSRSSLYNLTVPCKANSFKPAVPAKTLRQSGCVQGIHLIPYDALMTYLRGLPDSVEDKKALGRVPEEGKK